MLRAVGATPRSLGLNRIILSAAFVRSRKICDWELAPRPVSIYAMLQCDRWQMRRRHAELQQEATRCALIRTDVPPHLYHPWSPWWIAPHRLHTPRTCNHPRVTAHVCALGSHPLCRSGYVESDTCRRLRRVAPVDREYALRCSAAHTPHNTAVGRIAAAPEPLPMQIVHAQHCCTF
jgi:hypothetical protein